MTILTNSKEYNNDRIEFRLTGEIPESGKSETQVFIVTFEDRCSNIKLEPPMFGTEKADQGMFEVETYFSFLAPFAILQKLINSTFYKKRILKVVKL